MQWRGYDGLIGAGIFLVAQRPSFWIAFGAWLGKALHPSVLKYITKRMPSEEEASWRAAEKRGRGDEWLRKRRFKIRNSTP
jgi:hypothetical protein